MEKHESEELIKETIAYAAGEIRKAKRRSLALAGGILLSVFLAWGAYILVFVLESPVAYRQGIVEVVIPDDKGIDVYVTLPNYQQAKAVLVKTGTDSYDLYIGVTQTLATKFVKDSDTQDNLLRVGNGLIVDFQSQRLQGVLPHGYQEGVIGRIYYIDSLSDALAAAPDEQLMALENKTLIWEK